MVMFINPTIENRSYFFPVDGEGVLLPGNEFAEAETRGPYLHQVLMSIQATQLEHPLVIVLLRLRRHLHRYYHLIASKLKYVVSESTVTRGKPKSCRWN